MTLTTKTLLVGAGILALTACSDSATKNFNSEAGAFLDEGGFGNPTMTNMMAQMCKGKAKGYIVPDPIVAVDGKSTPPRYVQGTVYCSGQLNGQYARVIWSDYIASGRPQTVLSAGGVEATTAGGGG